MSSKSVSLQYIHCIPFTNGEVIEIVLSLCTYEVSPALPGSMYCPSMKASDIAKSEDAWKNMQAEMDKAGQGYLLQNNAASAGLWCSPCYKFYEILRNQDGLLKKILDLAVTLSGIAKEVRTHIIFACSAHCVHFNKFISLTNTCC